MHGTQQSRIRFHSAKTLRYGALALVIVLGLGTLWLRSGNSVIAEDQTTTFRPPKGNNQPPAQPELPPLPPFNPNPPSQPLPDQFRPDPRGSDQRRPDQMRPDERGLERRGPKPTFRPEPPLPNENGRPSQELPSPNPAFGPPAQVGPRNNVPVPLANPGSASANISPNAAPHPMGVQGTLSSFDPVLLGKLARPGDLTLKSSTLSEALFSISATWKINVVLADDIQGQVSGVFVDAPLHEILDSILLVNGYSYRPVGQSLVVMKLRDLGDINPLMESAIVPITNGKPEEILLAVKTMSSGQGKVQVVASARSLLVVDFPDKVALIKSFVQRFDAAALNLSEQEGGPEGPGGRMQYMTYRAQFVESKFLKDPLTTVLSKEGKIATMELDNQVIVYDYPVNLRLVQRSLHQLDVPRKQVRITALIYDLNLQDVESIGLNWNNALKGRPDSSGKAQTLLSLDSVTSIVTPTTAAANGILTFSNFSKNVDLIAVAQCLQQCTNSRLLADPHVSVYDGELAKFEEVTEIPYQQLTQTTGGGNLATTSFREAGVKLMVTPRIAEDGTIRMECNPVFSRLSGYTPGTNSPVIDRREAKTTLRVANHQTLVIGGLRTRTDVRDNSGIPYLKDIPLIGALFRSKDSTIKESELVVFVTPDIINVDEPVRPRERGAHATSQCYLDHVPAGKGCPNCCDPSPLPTDDQGVAIRNPVSDNPNNANTTGMGEEVAPGPMDLNIPLDARPDGAKNTNPKTDAAKRNNPPSEKSAPVMGPQLRQPEGYVSKQPNSTKTYQPPVVAAPGAYRPATAPATTQVAKQSARFEAFPSMESPAPATASRTFDSLPPLGENRPGINR